MSEHIGYNIEGKWKHSGKPVSFYTGETNASRVKQEMQEDYKGDIVDIKLKKRIRDARSSPQKSKSWLCGMSLRPAKYP